MRPSWKIFHDGVSVQLELTTLVDQKKLVVADVSCLLFRVSLHWPRHSTKHGKWVVWYLRVHSHGLPTVCYYSVFQVISDSHQVLRWYARINQFSSWPDVVQSFPKWHILPIEIKDSVVVLLIRQQGIIDGLGFHPQWFNLQPLPCTINGDGLHYHCRVPQFVFNTTGIRSEIYSLHKYILFNFSRVIR